MHVFVQVWKVSPQQVWTTFAVGNGQLPQFQWREHHHLQCVGSGMVVLAALFLVHKMLEPWAAVGLEVPFRS